MAMNSSMSLIKSRGTPAPSLPMKMASGPLKVGIGQRGFLCVRRSPPCELYFCRIAELLRASLHVVIGNRKTEPADARTTFGFR